MYTKKQVLAAYYRVTVAAYIYHVGFPFRLLYSHFVA